MTNKYYTPELSEFHHGFEYEIKEMCSINKGPRQIQWNKQIVSGLGSTELHWRISSYPEEIRVKYLSKQDIEDCGFELNSSLSSDFTNNIVFTLKDYRLDWYYETNNIIVNRVDGDNFFRLFDGIINNKSEFKKLLKWINVD